MLAQSCLHPGHNTHIGGAGTCTMNAIVRAHAHHGDTRPEHGRPTHHNVNCRSVMGAGAGTPARGSGSNSAQNFSAIHNDNAL